MGHSVPYPQYNQRQRKGDLQVNTQLCEEDAIVNRFLRVQRALGPHAADLVGRYKESTHVDLDQVVSRVRGLRIGDIDPLHLRSRKGLACIGLVVGIAFGCFGPFVGMCCLSFGIALHVQADRQTYQFSTDLKHLDTASKYLEFLAKYLVGADGATDKIIANHVHLVAIGSECGAESKECLYEFVDIASHFKLVSPVYGVHEKAARKAINAHAPHRHEHCHH